MTNSSIDPVPVDSIEECREKWPRGLACCMDEVSAASTDGAGMKGRR
jgi:hypothetical protein